MNSQCCIGKQKEEQLKTYKAVLKYFNRQYSKIERREYYEKN